MGRALDKEALWEMRQEVAGAVEDQINRLLRYRYEDRKQNWGRVRRWLAPLDARHPAIRYTSSTSGAISPSVAAGTAQQINASSGSR